MKELEFIKALSINKRKEQRVFPNKHDAESFIESLFSFLFINNITLAPESAMLTTYAQLKNKFAALLFESGGEEAEVEKNTALFFDRLPILYAVLQKDALAIYESDPAARSVEEVIGTYPGFYATAIYRLSHQVWKQDVNILPRLFTEYAHSKTGIDIHPGASIGESFSIDHGTGIVIGETTVIGEHVKIFQGVTLGALNVAKNNVGAKRHPSIKDRVIIYSGATILGGNTIVGEDSIIGGNVWLTHSVASHSVVYHKSEIKVRDNNPLPFEFDFVI